MTSEQPEASPPFPLIMPRLLRLILWTRFLSAIAILASLAATVLMLIIGTQNMLRAFAVFFFEAAEPLAELEAGEEATLLLLESLDNFLIGLAFLYFAYGIYALFIAAGQNILSFMPQWLRVSNISALKKSLLEVVVVLLSVVFVKGLLERIATDGLRWEFLVIPLSIVAIALSLKLMNLDEGGIE